MLENLQNMAGKERAHYHYPGPMERTRKAVTVKASPLGTLKSRAVLLYVAFPAVISSRVAYNLEMQGFSSAPH